MIHFIPIEPLEERYSAQMLRWVTDGLKDLNVPYATYLPQGDYSAIATGQFLDVFNTIKAKTSQISQIAESFSKKQIGQGDIFLFGDLWFPGIEAIRYMSQLACIKVYIAGWHYAGMFDPYDFLTQHLGIWATAWERNLLKSIVDLVCVGSHYHKRLIVDRMPDMDVGKIFPYGLAWKPEAQSFARPERRQKIVVFPHRLAPEKNFEAFLKVSEALRASFPDWRWIVSTNSSKPMPDLPAHIETARHGSKHAYYDFLATCAIFYSNAFQETFGYALNEAIAVGLDVVAPYRCSYPEALNHDKRFLFDPVEDQNGEALLAKKMKDFDRGEGDMVPFYCTTKYAGSHIRFLKQMLALEHP